MMERFKPFKWFKWFKIVQVVQTEKNRMIRGTRPKTPVKKQAQVYTKIVRGFSQLGADLRIVITGVIA